MSKRDFEKNIWKYYLFVFCREFMLILPIFILFYQENGLTLNQIGFIATAVSITGLILEVPSGVIADLYGRKLSMLLGASLLIIGALLRAASTSFLNFMIALIVFSGGWAFMSGADSAFLYDSLKEIKKEYLFKKILGTANFLLLISMSLAAFVGGLLAVYGLRTVHYIVIVPLGLAFLIAFSFKEPKEYRKIIKTRYFEHLKESLFFSMTHKKVRALILFSGLIIGMMLISHIFFQPYMKQLGVSTTSFGIIYLCFLGIAALSSKGAYLIEEKIGVRNSIILISSVLVIQLILMGLFSFYWAFLFLFLSQFVWGFGRTIISHYINDTIESHHRATVLSIDSMCNQFFWALFAPLLGWFADIWSLQTAVLIQAGITMVFLLIISALWKLGNSGGRR